jgi:hypothetical protein
MRWFAPRTSLVLATASLTVASFAVGLAAAERSGRAGILVSFDGSVSPKRLPRHRLVPISLTIRGAIGADDGSPAPKLERIEVAFGARNGLSTAGLPRCPRRRLRNATSAQALERCRGALVGRGEILSEVPLAPENPLIVRARVLAFNGRADGRPAVWIHAYSASPPVSFILPFYLRRPSGGTYGVLLRAPVSRALGRWPRLRSFAISFGRRYASNGRRLSYLSAHCPQPPRFHAGFFPLARATYHFAPAPKVSIAILRRCRVAD